LHRVDLGRDASTNISDAWRISGLRAFDVSPDGRRVVFTAFEGGQEDLWTANIDGTSVKRLSNDRLLEFRPLWTDNRSVVFQSNRGGQIDLWSVDVDSGRFEQLTSSDTTEEPESASADGRLVSFRQMSVNSSLWTWDPARALYSQLTDDALSDLAPSSSADGQRVVFQRSRRSPLLGNPLADSTLFVGLLDGVRFRAEPTPIADGFAPRLSPDGSRLAYMQGGADQLNTLFVKHLQSGETVTVSTTTPQLAYFEPLAEWMDQNLAWNASGTTLYFVDRSDVFTLRRFEVGAAAPGEPLGAAGPREIIHDVHVSPDGNVAYLVTTSRGEILHILNGPSDEDHVTVPVTGTATIRGWLPGGHGLVVARSALFREDFTAEVEILVASTAGVLRPVGVVDGAFLVTTRLDSNRGVLYLARVENGLHNVYEFSLTTGRLRRITDNNLPGVRFSGAEPLGRTGLISVRQERRSDIWMLVASPARGADEQGRR
jgi:Tol biopolymer transport system component